MSFEFNEDTHTYRFEEEEIPSVSEILRFISNDIYGVKRDSKAALGKAADRGSRIHRAAEEIDRTGMTDCDPDIVQYVSAYVQFLKDHDVKWELIETPILRLSPYKYAGTLDRYGVVDGKRMLIDIKSTRTIGKKEKLMYETQLNAYSEAHYIQTSPTTLSAKTIGVDEMAVLQLKADGTYKLIPVAKNDEIWWLCMRLHDELNKTKSKRKKAS